MLVVVQGVRELGTESNVMDKFKSLFLNAQRYFVLFLFLCFPECLSSLPTIKTAGDPV